MNLRYELMSDADRATLATVLCDCISAIAGRHVEFIVILSDPGAEIELTISNVDDDRERSIVVDMAERIKRLQP